MARAVTALTLLLSVALVLSGQDNPSYPFFSYKVARAHEIKPHRRCIPIDVPWQAHGQLRLLLTVSQTGDVLDVEASSDPVTIKLWPQFESEVHQWKFKPFEKDGQAVTAKVQEYIDFVLPERFPTVHVPGPVVRPDSKVTITLEKTGCFGDCPAYKVTVSTDGVVFEGYRFVANSGAHKDNVNPDEVRKLAKRFVASDFYSMDSRYDGSITDGPTYTLSISIDGQTKKVVDYIGQLVGMPAVIAELEDEVDAMAGTRRWIGKEE